jgi:hypothetical protein
MSPEDSQLRAVFLMLGGVVLCAGLAIYGLAHLLGAP